MDATNPAVVVLDVNETLTDMTPVRHRFVDLGASEASFDAWFAATLRDGFAVTAAGGYAEFADIARHTVTTVLATHLADPSEAAAGADYVLAALPELEVHPDVPDGLEQRLSVAAAGRWKPAPESYTFAATTVGEEPAALALVASHPWDVDGAARAGLVGAWLNRDGSDYPPYMTAPAVTASSMPTLADRLLGA